MEAPDLVREAMRTLGADSPAKLADALGMRGRYDHEKIKKWLEGKSKPSYDATLQLLEVTGRLREAEGTDGLATTLRPRSLEATTAAILALNVENFEKVNRSLDRLVDRVDRLEKRLPERAAPRRRSGQRG